jgi:hypothetical protein
LERHHLVLVPPTRLHVCQHSRAKERLVVPKERLDEKRGEYEWEKKEKEEERLGFFRTPANPVPAKYVLLTYRASPSLEGQSRAIPTLPLAARQAPAMRVVAARSQRLVI